ncbi:MAG: hypothetical protein OXB84_04775 [Halobacteriovoraceae bacterium]|nr:hypothetical protein [Halobacteriovoraceae bacterium]
MWKLFKNKKESRDSFFIQKKKFKKAFFDKEHHCWIKQNSAYQKAFSLLIDSFDQKTLDFLKREKEIVFLQASGKLACSLSAIAHSHIILVYPDLTKLLKSAFFLRGVAVLAHELGHLYHNHGSKDIDPLQAQIEADQFACKLGFGYELQEVLLEYKNSIDCRARVGFLTSEFLKTNSQ